VADCSLRTALLWRGGICLGALAAPRCTSMQIALEREELAEYPQEEAEELALIYQARGMDLARARELSQALLARRQQALDVLAPRGARPQP